MNLEQILVKLTHLLVSLKQILVNSSVTPKYEKFPFEMELVFKRLKCYSLLNCFGGFQLKEEWIKKS
ncbi:hypothetical protein JMN23_00870 [Bacillus sp. RHFB]|nr:hypothetical protein [Bacillus sp. RHFB]